MKIELREITVRDLTEGYKDSGAEGVVGYGGRLNIRPPYQREFIYKEKQRDAVITTITQNFPLNVMYWADCGDGTFEVIDGQQRTISICQYVAGEFAYMFRYFHNLTSDEKRQILEYPLMVYVCTGSDSEKLKWFQTINIAGEKLTEQELRNAVYSGPWVSDAKRYFSKNSCPAYMVGKDFMSGSPIRQDYLETVIQWISGNKIEGYMARHQHDSDASALWIYFQSVISWAQAKFSNKHKKIINSVEWGALYNIYKDAPLNPAEIEKEVQRLLLDDDVTKPSGIYPYILTRDEKHLSIRAFSEKQKLETYTRQGGVCPMCGGQFELSAMEADHITPWSEGGATTADNCQMLCRHCNRRKSNK
ncbi:MAG: DUF262 domain-containing protein [Tidjanibacter sp.]|nr:DUF262 domain-containing protein [Tidjanibacter sp.]